MTDQQKNGPLHYFIERLSSMATRMRETKAAGRAIGFSQTYFLNQPLQKDDKLLLLKTRLYEDPERPFRISFFKRIDAGSS